MSSPPGILVAMPSKNLATNAQPPELPLVSVVTPVYNGSRFLTRCMSCVRQQGVAYEHILVDDGSTDDSRLILVEAQRTDPHLKIIALDSNEGVIEARNAGIRVAKGRYLAFLDVDDVWLPNKLAGQIAFMAKNDLALTFTDYRFISEDGRRIGRRLKGPDRIGWNLHHMTRYLGCLTIVVDRALVPDFSFDVVADFRAEDFLAWSKIILRQGPAVRYPYDLARYAVVTGSRSSNGLGAAKKVWALYRDIERIPLFRRAMYFASYALFTLLKRRVCRPVWLNQNPSMWLSER